MSESVRHCGVLIVDIAGSVKLRKELGEVAAGRQIHHLLDTLIGAARRCGATFIKAYGDDMLAVFEEAQLPATAARRATRRRDHRKPAARIRQRRAGVSSTTITSSGGNRCSRTASIPVHA